MNAQVTPFPFSRIFSEPMVESIVFDPGLAERVVELELEREAMKAQHDAALLAVRCEAFQQGLDLARTERETALLAAVDSLQASIESVEDGLAEIEMRLAHEAGELALTAADFIAARALEIDATTAIDDAIGRALIQVPRGQPVRIRVHPDLVADIERLVAERQASERRRLSLMVFGDDALVPGDAVLQWDQGGLRLDAEGRRAAVRAELDGILPRA
jgi:flagellar assembly protein FliH